MRTRSDKHEAAQGHAARTRLLLDLDLIRGHLRVRIAHGCILLVLLRRVVVLGSIGADLVVVMVVRVHNIFWGEGNRCGRRGREEEKKKETDTRNTQWVRRISLVQVKHHQAGLVCTTPVSLSSFTPLCSIID